MDFIHLLERRLTQNNDELIKQLNFLLLYPISKFKKKNIFCFKVFLFYRSNSCKDYFTSTAVQWESAINWLKQQMQTSWQWSPANNLSNEDNDGRSFQRTRSAQFTLEQAQSLLQQTTITPSNDTSSSEFMELSDNHNKSSSSQSTLIRSD